MQARRARSFAIVVQLAGHPFTVQSQSLNPASLEC